MLNVAADPRLDRGNVYSCPKTRFAKKCTETKALLLQKQKKAEEKEKQPLKPNDPLHTASKAKLKSALKQIRLSEKKARLELEKIKNKIHSESVSMSENLHTSTKIVMKENQITDPFMQLFFGLNSKRPLNVKEKLG